jgi:hypothetical protein
MKLVSELKSALVKFMSICVAKDPEPVPSCRIRTKKAVFAGSAILVFTNALILPMSMKMQVLSVNFAGNLLEQSR